MGVIYTHPKKKKISEKTFFILKVRTEPLKKKRRKKSGSTENNVVTLPVGAPLLLSLKKNSKRTPEKKRKDIDFRKQSLGKFMLKLTASFTRMLVGDFRSPAA